MKAYHIIGKLEPKHHLVVNTYSVKYTVQEKLEEANIRSYRSKVKIETILFIETKAGVKR